jgi:hypothetical protein
MSDNNKYIGYCLKEKVKHDMKDAEIKHTKNGRSYVSGLCSSCNCKMNVFLKKEKSEMNKKLEKLVQE